MADEDILIKNLPTTESVNDDDDIVIEDASPTTYRIKAGDLRSYITSEVARQIGELEETKANQTEVDQNAKDIATNASAIEEVNQSLTDNVIYEDITLDSIEVAGNAISYTATTNISKSGYQLIGATSRNNDNGSTLFYRCCILSNTQFVIYVYNTTSTTRTISPKARVIYLKT